MNELLINWEKVEAEGILPNLIVGQSCVLISKIRVILFGGEIISSSKLEIINRIFQFNIFKKQWMEILGLLEQRKEIFPLQDLIMLQLKLNQVKW